MLRLTLLAQKIVEEVPMTSTLFTLSGERGHKEKGPRISPRPPLEVANVDRT